MVESNNSILIRRMTPEDVDMVYEHVMNCIGQSAAVNKVYETIHMDRWRSHYTKEILSNMSDDNHVYLLFDNGELVSTAAISVDEEDPTWAEITMVLTNSEVQGKGYGKKILEHLETDEIALKLGRMRLEASLGAYDFYKNLGWSFPGEEFEMSMTGGAEKYPLIKILSD